MNKKLPTFDELGLNELDARDRSLYLMWESSHYRAERINLRLWIVILVLIVALVGTNVGWLIYESQFTEVMSTTQTVSQEASTDGDGAITLQHIGGNYVGESETNDNNNSN